MLTDPVMIGSRVRPVDDAPAWAVGTVKAIDADAGEAWVRYDGDDGNTTEKLLLIEIVP